MNADRTPDAQARRDAERADEARRMRSAISDVMEGGMPVSLVFAARNVGRDALRRELDQRGWKPVRIRSNSTRSRAKRP